ncbi:hypothetical protein ASR47_10378 [Janthinobacterium psychrotolerans]|uniref:Uncharacterized protein n=2 Tax=Janthinobacterium psychrotolerans TaxID=1747903 RepID=A0A1A7CA12_9BURK|nr:hypothetical protein ASR47_10378 [Janthinobacterium psychrotolerans]
MKNDLHFMCKIFSKRQAEQLKSLNILSENNYNDLILVARSMFEGSIYLANSIKDKDMCLRWRLYSVLHDKKRMDKEGNAPPEIVDMINKWLPEIDRLFKKKNGEYQKNWHGKTIKDLAANAGDEFLHFYNNYYSLMSEYHHWDTAAFGKRYKINENYIDEIKSEEVELERVLAMSMALSSAFATFNLSQKILNSTRNEKLAGLESELKNIPGTITKTISISP